MGLSSLRLLAIILPGHLPFVEFGWGVIMVAEVEEVNMVVEAGAVNMEAAGT
jgi:hypothetical protein